MGDDEAKIEKKRLKAEQKVAKKAAKAKESYADIVPEAPKTEEPATASPPTQPDPVEQPVPEPKSAPQPAPAKAQPRKKQRPRPIIVKMPKVPWYKVPRWISAIIGAVSLSLVLITLFTDWL